MMISSPSLLVTVWRLMNFDDTFVARLERRLLGAPARGAADVEGAHGELRAGLADRLGGDDADGLAEVHHVAARARSRP